MSHKAGSSTTEVRNWLDAAHRRLREHSDVLDDLNVFPVADADTGANLSATVGFAAEAAHLIEGRDVGELLVYAGQAALEQARGNSGVLAAVALTAMGQAVEGCVRLTAAQLKAALMAAQVRCWSALTEPVPGTMISVLQAAGEVPVPDTAAEGSNQQLVEWLDLMVQAATQAVIDTVDQIPVLSERGTVDSGALGMLVILDAPPLWPGVQVLLGVALMGSAWLLRRGKGFVLALLLHLAAPVVHVGLMYDTRLVGWTGLIARLVIAAVLTVAVMHCRRSRANLER